MDVGDRTEVHTLDLQGWYTGVNSRDGDPEDHVQKTPFTRAQIEAEFRYRLTDLTKPARVPSPRRVWTDEEMWFVRRGWMARAMEEKWHGWMESDRLFLSRSWTGYGIYVVDFMQVGDGWRISKVLGEADLDIYQGRYSEAYESVNVETAIVRMLLGRYEEKLEKRWTRAFTKGLEGPHLDVKPTTWPPVQISKPGPSPKHGKVADQHQLQREAYDEFSKRGSDEACSFLDSNRIVEQAVQDVWWAGRSHEDRALKTVGIESSRHAGLAKGAFTAAWKRVNG